MSRAFAHVAWAAALGAGGALLYVVLRRLDLSAAPMFVVWSMRLLLTFLVLLVLRYFFLLWFSYLEGLDGEAARDDGERPFVSILVPAYNEERVIAASLNSLRKLRYPRYEVIVIDDGSTDGTLAAARREAARPLAGGPEVRVLRKPNGGKASALNHGIRAARGELVVCMDGDSRLDPAALLRAVPHFRLRSVGAVAGSVKVANQDSVLMRLQALEYIEGLNLVRRAQAFFRAVSIVPGPIGIFRREVLDQVGGYDADTFAEDCDLTLKILSCGWQVRYEPGAAAYTEAPESLLELIKQRYRWTRGILQAARKHRRALVRPVGGWSMTVSLWYMLFEGLAWPAANVFAHLLFSATAVLYGVAELIVLWWLQLTVLDMCAALYCVSAEEEDLRLVPYATLYRLWFALVIDVAKVGATLEELFRVRMEWGKLERKGRI